MRFRTELTPNKSTKSIRHTDGMVLLGSCFADNLGDKLLSHRFKALVNPLGTFYNPVSASTLLQILQSGKLVVPGDLTERDGIFVHHHFHSRFNHPSPDQVVQSINEALDLCRDFIKSAGFLFLTLGTAWVYEKADTGEIVSNCHKRPSSLFRKRLLSLSETVSALDLIYRNLHQLNPDCRLILTLSPVRHLKDGLENNQLSKALLRLAIHQCYEASYFPAYELVLDDLRDYRFYKEDLLHPNEMAVQYLWEKFCYCYFDEDTLALIRETGEINGFLNHKTGIRDDSYMRHKLLVEEKISKINPSLGIPYPI